MYSTGDTDIKISVHNEKNVSAEFILDEANTMWKKTKEARLDSADLSGADKLMDRLRKEHPDFCKAYPIVLRYMCQMQEYNPKAFKRYLSKIAAKPYKNEEEYLDSQADYVVILYKSQHSRWNKTHIVNLRTNIRMMLQKEHDTIKKCAKECDEEVTQMLKEAEKQNTMELLNFIKSAGVAGMSTGGTYRVITDEPAAVPSEFWIDKSMLDLNENNFIGVSLDDLLN
jgi:hypothetical protein